MNGLPLYYINIFNNLNGLINTKDLNSKITSVNEDVLKILGKQQKDMLNKNYNELDLSLKTLLKSLKNKICTLLKTNLL